MQVSKREAETVFRKLNVETKRSNHHIAGWVTFEGKKLFLIHYSHGKGDMPGRIGVKFAKSLKLKEQEFRRFAKCKISADEYYSLIEGR